MMMIGFCLWCQKKVVDGENNEVAANKLSDDVALSEEVNGTPQQHRDHHHIDNHEPGTPPAAQEEEDDNVNDDDDDDSEEEVEHPGEVSIGRKLWTFIST